MSEKVKVSREVAEAIETALKEYNKETFISMHVIDLDSGGYTWLELRNYDLDKLIRAVYIGYEIEKTPEEKILHDFYMYRESAEYDSGWKDGVTITLETLGIKIKGIND